MSHATGEIWSPEGALLGHFEYNGTVDVACTRVYSTVDEMQEHWRGENWKSCTCQTVGEPVILFTDYGEGFYWGGRVCWKCRAIVDGIKVWDDDIITADGHPFPNKRES